MQPKKPTFQSLFRNIAFCSYFSFLNSNIRKSGSDRCLPFIFGNIHRERFLKHR